MTALRLSLGSSAMVALALIKVYVPTFGNIRPSNAMVFSRISNMTTSAWATQSVNDTVTKAKSSFNFIVLSFEDVQFVKVEVTGIGQHRFHVRLTDAKPIGQFCAQLVDGGTGQQATAAHLLVVGQANFGSRA